MWSPHQFWNWVHTQYRLLELLLTDFWLPAKNIYKIYNIAEYFVGCFGHACYFIFGAGLGDWGVQNHSCLHVTLFINTQNKKIHKYMHRIKGSQRLLKHKQRMSLETDTNSLLLGLHWSLLSLQLAVSISHQQAYVWQWWKGNVGTAQQDNKSKLGRPTGRGWWRCKLSMSQTLGTWQNISLNMLNEARMNKTSFRIAGEDYIPMQGNWHAWIEEGYFYSARQRELCHPLHSAQHVGWWGYILPAFLDQKILEWRKRRKWGKVSNYG